MVNLQEQLSYQWHYCMYVCVCLCVYACGVYSILMSCPMHLPHGYMGFCFYKFISILKYLHAIIKEI